MEKNNNFQEALAAIRADRDKKGTLSNKFYEMLSTADPNVLEFIEYQIAQAYSAGKIIGDTIKEKASTQEGRRELSSMLSSLNQNSGFDSDSEKD